MRSWWNPHSGSSSSRRVCRVCAQGFWWSYSIRRRSQPWTEQVGLVHSRAIFCAVVGPRPRWVTFSHVDPVGDDQFEDGLAEQVPGHRDRDRADPGDFAQFLTLHVAAAQRLRVDPQQGQVARIGRLPRRAPRPRPGLATANAAGGAGVGGEDPRITRSRARPASHRPGRRRPRPVQHHRGAPAGSVDRLVRDARSVRPPDRPPAARGRVAAPHAGWPCHSARHRRQPRRRQPRRRQLRRRRPERRRPQRRRPVGAGSIGVSPVAASPAPGRASAPAAAAQRLRRGRRAWRRLVGWLAGWWQVQWPAACSARWIRASKA